MIEVEESGQHLTCELAAIDSLGCAMNHLSLRTQALASVSGDELKTVAESLAGRLSYLLEAVSTVEFDAEQCVVQMRSSPPQKDEDATSYYELLASRGGHLSLKRYTKTAGEARQETTAHLEVRMSPQPNFPRLLCNPHQDLFLCQAHAHLRTHLDSCGVQRKQ